MADAPDALTVIDQVSTQVTFDDLLRRDPTSVADRVVYRANVIRLARAQRAQWQTKSAERKARKESQE